MKTKKNSSKKANKRKQKGVVSNIRNICVAVADNPFGGTIIAIFIFCIAGVANAVLSGFFSACGIAIKDSSRSLFQKIVDVYYIGAAKFEPTDLCLFQWLFFVELMIGLFWLLHLGTKELVSTMEHELEKRQPKDNNFNQEDSTENSQEEAFRKNLQQRLSRIKTRRRINFLLSILGTVLLLYILSSTIISFEMVKGFRRSVTEIRPFLSEDEYLHLNRKWVMMKSREDYKVIKQRLSEYKERAGHDNMGADAAILLPNGENENQRIQTRQQQSETRFVSLKQKESTNGVK